LKTLSQSAKTFIGGCLAKTSFVRMRPEEALCHPWIYGIEISEKSISTTSSPLKIKSSDEFSVYSDELSPELVTRSLSLGLNKQKRKSSRLLNLLDLNEIDL